MASFFQGLEGLDYLILGLIILLVIRGFAHGCSGEIGRLMGVLAAGATLFFGLKPVSQWITGLRVFNGSQFGSQLLLFICMLVLSVSVWLLVSKLLADAIKLAVRQPFDAVLGGVIGGVKAIVLLSILCTLGLLTPHQSVENALAGQSSFINKISQWVKPFSNPGR